MFRTKMSDGRNESWSARSAYKVAFQRLAKRPLSSFAALGVVPAIWNLPIDLARRQLLPTEPPDELDLSYVALSQACALASSIWWAIPFGGTILIALDLVRGIPTSFKRYRDGLLAAAPLVAGQILLFGPLSLLVDVAVGPLGPGLFPIALAVFALCAHVIIKSFCALPLIVEYRVSVLTAFRVSWALMVGVYWRAVRVLLISFVSVFPLFAVEDSLWLTALWMALTSPVIDLAMAQAYDWIQRGKPIPSPFARSARAELAPSDAEQDLPVRGSGWAKPIRDSRR